MADDDNESTISSYCSSTDSGPPAVKLTEDELEKLIQLFKKDIHRNYGIFISLNKRKKKKVPIQTQTINNDKCTINQQHNNYNVTVNKNKQHEIPFDIPRYTTQFFGRQKEVEKLNKILQEHKLVILTGIEGIGKSELTKYYIEKYFEMFEGNIEWINGSTKEKFNQSIAYLADKHQTAVIPKDFVGYYQNKSVLIIIDNAYEKIQYRNYFPRSSNISVILSTEFPDLNNKKCLMNLGPLTEDESIDLFQSIFGELFSRSDEYDWEKLSKYFESIPLALQIIGACLNENMLENNSLTVDNYLKDLKKKKHLILENPLEEEYNKVYFSLRLSLERIITSETDSIICLEILNICVYLDDDYISKQVLFAHENIKKSKEKLNKVLNTLKKYKLITIEIKQNTNEIHIHNLLRRMLLLQQKNEGTSKKYFKMTLGLFATMGLYNIKYLFGLAKGFTETLVQHIIENNLLYLLDVIVQNGHDKILDQLLKSLPDSKTVMDEYDLLAKAIEYDQPSIVKVLIKHKVDIHKLTSKLRSPLHKASKKCILAIIISLLLDGADANAQDYKNNTPLHTVVGIGYRSCQNEEQAIQCSRALIRNGADINAENIERNTPLHLALQNKAFKLALFLLDQAPSSIKIFNLNTSIRTIFEWDIDSDKEELLAYRVIKTLLLKGANKNVTDSEGRNLLIWAVDNKCPKIITFLLEDCSISVNHQDLNGNTALHKVLSQIIYNKKDAQTIVGIIRTLLDNKSKTDIENNDGYTAYDLCKNHGNMKLCLYVQFLNHELTDKKKKMFYLPDKQHRKPEKKTTSSARQPFWYSNTDPYRQAISDTSSRRLEYASSGNFKYQGFQLAQAVSWRPSQPPSIPGPSYCNNLLN